MPTLLDKVFKECERSTAEQALALTEEDLMKMVRFNDNEVSVTKSWNNESILIYLIKEGRKAACLLEDVSERAIRRSIQTILASAKNIRKGEISPSLPKGPFNYGGLEGCYDKRLREVDERLSEFVGSAVDSALQRGAEKVSGTFIAVESERRLKSTEGCVGEDRHTYFEFTVRAFSDGDASGHANWCGATLDGFSPAELGGAAGELSSKSKNVKEGRPGEYDLVLSPSVMGNLLDNVGEAASAYLVDIGMSFLKGRLNEKIAAEAFTLVDNPRLGGSPGGSLFDDEGSPTKPMSIIDRGILKGYLHSSYTAEKEGVERTGSAYFDNSIGDMVPTPKSLIVESGEYEEKELIQDVKDGLYITNTWYTRFQNYQEGSFSTIPRDTIIRIRRGELAEPVKNVRISGDMLGILKSIKGISSRRYWIRWWELDTPILLPYFLVEKVKVSRSTK